MPRPARITVVTSGHLSTCPRMLKAADALAAAGYDVSVVATLHEPWATDADVDVRSRRAWPVHLVDYRRNEGASTYWWSGVEHRAAKAIVGAVGPERAPLPVAMRAFGRVHSSLLRAISSVPADFIYGGTTGALAAVAEAARRTRTPYALDLEDYHSAEASGPTAPQIDALATRIEQAVLGGAVFLTTSSEAIADAYRERYDIHAAVVHNTFPLPAEPPDFARADPDVLRAYWFSQTIGPGRGVDEAIVALGRAGVRAELALRGRPHDGYVDALRSLAATHAPRLALIHHPPAPPDAMVDLARANDVGLVLEHGGPRNRDLCVTNKGFTYILAGLAVAGFDTPGLHDIGVDFGRAAQLVPRGDVDALAATFARWNADPAALDRAKRTAWQAATRRWHWEHEAERGTLYRLVDEALA
jgi:glycosyltransferase involved in cell wall biosynthesis